MTDDGKSGFFYKLISVLVNVVVVEYFSFTFSILHLFNHQFIFIAFLSAIVPVIAPSDFISYI